jgi:outer membrane immunogenic protein
VYIGGHVGGTVGQASPGNTSGLVGGVHLGVNGQFDRVVVGVEADVGTTTNNHTGFGVKYRQGANGTLRARAGVAFDRVLVYGTAGLAVSNHEFKNQVGKASRTQSGTAIGVGGEIMLTDTIAARAEYLRKSYSRASYASIGGPARLEPINNVLRGGLSYRF